MTDLFHGGHAQDPRLPGGTYSISKLDVHVGVLSPSLTDMGSTEGGCVRTSLLVTRPSRETLQPEARSAGSRGRFADANATTETRIPGAENGTGEYVTFASSITLLTVEATAIRPSQCPRLQDVLDTPHCLLSGVSRACFLAIDGLMLAYASAVDQFM